MRMRCLRCPELDDSLALHRGTDVLRHSPKIQTYLVYVEAFRDNRLLVPPMS